MPIRKVPRKENTRVLSFHMFYENRKNIIFKVLSTFFIVPWKTLHVLIICVVPKLKFMLQIKDLKNNI